MSEASDALAFTETLQLLLEAIRDRREDDEMDCRSTLKGQFRLTDEQINSRLFRILGDQATTKVRGKHDGVDLTRIEQLRYLIDGWVPRGDAALIYGSYGCGKTTMALGLAWALAKGLPFLDRTGNGNTGRSLFIATDSGAGPLIKAMDDLAIDPHDALLTNDDPAQMIWTWAHAPDQGHEAWRADINGVVELKRFIQKHSIDLVLIDSAKSAAPLGGATRRMRASATCCATCARASASHTTRASSSCPMTEPKTVPTVGQRHGLKSHRWSSG